jgi:hypothetical protein
MVNVAKREDGLLDWANSQNRRVALALAQIDIYERQARTATETEMLNMLKGILRK